MRRESIDDDVWEFVAEKFGKFGDSWCDALRRGLEIPKPETHSTNGRSGVMSKSETQNRFAVKRLNRMQKGTRFTFSFGDGPDEHFDMPHNKDDKPQVRLVREKAHEWGKENGASPGQLNAIAKMFSDGGYYMGAPRR